MNNNKRLWEKIPSRFVLKLFLSRMLGLYMLTNFWDFAHFLAWWRKLGTVSHPQHASCFYITAMHSLYARFGLFGNHEKPMCFGIHSHCLLKFSKLLSILRYSCEIKKKSVKLLTGTALWAEAFPQGNKLCGALLTKGICALCAPFFAKRGWGST